LVIQRATDSTRNGQLFSVEEQLPLLGGNTAVRAGASKWAGGRLSRLPLSTDSGRHTPWAFYLIHIAHVLLNAVRAQSNDHSLTCVRKQVTSRICGLRVSMGRGGELDGKKSGPERRQSDAAIYPTNALVVRSR
jgi:hypothetical protein